MPRVTLHLSGDDAKALRSLERVIQKQSELERRGERYNQRNQRGLDDMIGKAATWAAGLVSVNAAWQGIVRSIQDAEEAAKRAAETQTQLAGTEQSLRANLGGMTVAEQNAFVQNVQGIASDTGVTAQTMYGAAATAISKAGGDRGLALQALEAGAELAPESPERLGALAGAAISMSRATGTEDAMVNIGMMQRIGDLSAVSNPAAQAQMVPRAILPSLGFGADARSAGALFALFTQIGEDVTGERSASGVARVSQEFSEFFGEDAKAQAIGAKSLEAQILALQARPEMAKRFIDQAGELGGTIAKGAMQPLLLDPESPAAQEFASILAALPTGEEGARERAGQMLASRGQVPGEIAADLERRMQKRVETAQASDEMRALYGTQVGQMGELMQAAGVPWNVRFLARATTAADRLTTGPEGALGTIEDFYNVFAAQRLDRAIGADTPRERRSYADQAQALQQAATDLRDAVADLKGTAANLNRESGRADPNVNRHVE